MPEEKYCVNVSNGLHKKKIATCKRLCNLQRITAFIQKHPNLNIGFSKFYALSPKWCFLDGSKMTHTVCVYSGHQNVVFLVNAMDRDLTKLPLSCLKYFN